MSSCAKVHNDYQGLDVTGELRIDVNEGVGIVVVLRLQHVAAYVQNSLFSDCSLCGRIKASGLRWVAVVRVVKQLTFGQLALS